MFSKFRIVLLGLVVSQGAILVAMEKKQETPHSPRRHRLSCSAELRQKKEQEFKNKPATILILTPQIEYHKHPGHSPIEYWVPYPYDNDSLSWQSDCP